MTPHRARAVAGPESLVELAVCPDCGALAEVLERFTVDSTDGPVEHWQRRCIEHWRRGCVERTPQHQHLYVGPVRPPQWPDAPR